MSAAFALVRRKTFDISAWLASPSILLGYRWLVVAATAVTFLVTWDLWRVRDTPPMLPALALPLLDMGIPLLLALAVVLVRPKIGVILYTVLLIYATLIDQTRIQPEFISFMFLMWGTLPGKNAPLIGRAYLISMWAWAGINKLLSPAFIASTGPGLLATLLPDAPIWLRMNGGYLIALSELSIGILAVFPKTRLFAALLALGVHTNILLILSPLGRNWNESVWGWNAALAFAGFALIAPWKETLAQSFRAARPLARVAVVILLIMPLGFYFGVVDAYLAHNLYSSNVPSASKTPNTWTLFEVPFPPEHRLFEQHFQLTCHKGEILQIRDTRWWFARQGMAQREITCLDIP
jgi:hypothetical protein